MAAEFVVVCPECGDDFCLGFVNETHPAPATLFEVGEQQETLTVVCPNCGHEERHG